jgi:4-hydroxy-tetrahydrodipicolinate synthase
MNLPLTGVFTAIVTPFDENGDFDEKTYKDLVEKQLKAEVAGIVPCGTTGESPTLSHSEHDHVIKLTVDLVGDKALVVAGTGSNSTREAVRLSQYAAEAGVDAVLLVNPYYNKPTQEGLFLHFRKIATSINIPCILYNIKGRTGVNLETDTLVRLCEACPNIIGVKEASGDIKQMREVIARTPSYFSVLSGDDNMTLDLIKEGGHGVVSVASNLVPEKMVTLVKTALSKDYAAAQELEYELGILFRATFLETNPIPIKAAMAMAGLCQEKYRLPLCPLSSESHRIRLKEILEELHIIEKQQTHAIAV